VAGGQGMKRRLAKRLERLELVMPRGDFDFDFSWGDSGTLASQGGAIDLVELERLCALHCPDQEIASFFGVTAKRIEQERQTPLVGAVMERGKAKGKIAIRREQMRLLEKGSSTMGVWLGRQILGQRDEGDAANQLIPVIVLPARVPTNEDEVQIMATPRDMRNRIGP
jgi:hypothetical protein